MTQEHKPIVFHIWNLGNYEGYKLVTPSGQAIVYRLDLKWQVREYSPEGFYNGALVTMFDAATEMAAYLNQVEAGLFV